MDEKHALTQDVHPVTGINCDFRNVPFGMNTIANEIADSSLPEQTSFFEECALKDVQNYDVYVQQSNPEAQETLFALAVVGYRFCINALINEWNTLPDETKKNPDAIRWYSQVIHEAMEGITSPYPEILANITPPYSEASETP